MRRRVRTALACLAAAAAAAAAAALGAGCGKTTDDRRAARDAGAVAASDATPTAPRLAIDPAARLEIVSEEVTFQVGARAVPGTVTRPTDASAPRPAVLLLAGSGPTDRDWNSPLLPGKNGSGKLLAEALARHGAVVLRFDKAFSGGNAGPPVAELTFDTYLDETRAALALLRGRPDVDAARAFVAGHSEGGIHATRLAAVEPGKVAGVVYLAAAARTMAETMLTQLEGNFRDGAGFTPEQIEAQMAPLRAAFADFAAGKPVDPAKASEFPQVQQLFASIMAPEAAALARPMFAFDPSVEAARLPSPALVLNGGKDVQVDPTLDAARLARHLTEAGRDVTLHISPDANHVLQHEPLTVTELRTDLLAVQNGYNGADRVLDADLAGALIGWLARRTAAAR